MKINLKKALYALFAIAVIAILSTGCKKNKPPVVPLPTEKTSATLNGPAGSNSAGNINVSYDPNTKVLSYTISWQLGSPAATTDAIHFHGEDGSSHVTIHITGFSTGSSGTFTGTTRPLTQAEEDQLLAGKWSFYIHTSLGELGGVIKFKS